MGVSLLVCGLQAACGGGGTEAVGTTTSSRVRGQPVRLELMTSDREYLFLEDLRGKPVVIFLFASFDGPSHASIRPLSRFTRHHPEVHVVAIAAQPDADQLAPLFAEAVAAPFIIAYDPEEKVAEGSSSLGPIEAVPLFLVLDAHGVIRERHVGFASQNHIEAMLERVSAPADEATAGQ